MKKPDTVASVRYVVLKNTAMEDGRGDMVRVREFTTKRAAHAWAKVQEGGWYPGDGWEVMKEVVDAEGYYKDE